MSTAPSQPWPVQRAYELLDDLAQETHSAAKDPDADAIHDIRVAIRRLRQCLEVFAPLFPAGASKKLDKAVRKLLKAAGEVRNLDIAVDLVKKARVARTGHLVGSMRKDRAKAEKDFTQALTKLDDGDLAEKWRKKLTATPENRVTGVYHAILPAMAVELFDAGDRAADPSADPDTLHKFRIKSKKFRYTLELFQPVYGEALDREMSALRKLQQRLGDINDYAASGRVLKSYSDGDDRLVDRALERLEQMAASETANFRRYFHRNLGPKQRDQWLRDLNAVKLGD